ncbi:MAG: MoxR family ATPase [Kiritimatiellaceae bacterium]|nr:MAG: MoxR family ATPase [Kiritimatiellaceae bacterium]|tara:strand:- start:1338 stop:2324 length:987 start_codon:yes stop_codon:yes gene_type:complete
MAGIEIINQRVREESHFVTNLKTEIGKVIVGQEPLIDRLIIGLLTNGHVLLEGVPGLAKTLTIQTLSQALSTDFQRIQFTPDLLPADLIGTLIYNQKEGDFIIKKGPIFSNIILADEINRAPAKVQSALLEAMQERQVTIGDETFPLPKPFLVMATENPVEQEGTYPLPEAQVDRFMLKICVDYPTRDEERLILDRMAHAEPPAPIQPILTPQQILNARQTVDEIYIDDKIKAYIIDLIFATRQPQDAGLPIQDYIKYGASPRATISLTLAARAHAFMQGRGYVTPQDIKSIAPDVLRHRLIISYEAEAEELTPDALIHQILAEIPVP